jgi:hypothetical protein
VEAILLRPVLRMSYQECLQIDPTFEFPTGFDLPGTNHDDTDVLPPLLDCQWVQAHREGVPCFGPICAGDSFSDLRASDVLEKVPKDALVATAKET